MSFELERTGCQRMKKGGVPQSIHDDLTVSVDPVLSKSTK